MLVTFTVLLMIVTLRLGGRIRLAQHRLADVADVDEVVIERPDAELDVDLVGNGGPS